MRKVWLDIRNSSSYVLIFTRCTVCIRNLLFLREYYNSIGHELKPTVYSSIGRIVVVSVRDDGNNGDAIVC